MVTTAEKTFQAAQKLCKKVSVIYRPQSQIQGENDNLPGRWERCKRILLAHSIHFAAKSSNSTITVAKNTQFFQRNICLEHILIKDVIGTPPPTLLNPPSHCHSTASGSKNPKSRENCSLFNMSSGFSLFLNILALLKPCPLYSILSRGSAIKFVCRN